jgi:hypothetical protein
MENQVSDTTKIGTLCGNVYVHITYDEYGCHDKVFISGMGKAGGCSSAWCQGLARMISLAFKKGASYMEVSEELRDIGCPTPFTIKGEQFKSCLDAMASLFEEKREEANDKSRKLNEEILCIKTTS